MEWIEIAINEEQEKYLKYASEVLQITRADVVCVMIDECVTRSKNINETERLLQEWSKNQNNTKLDKWIRSDSNEILLS